MKEVIFDIKKYSYIKDEEADVSFIPMMTRRKLDKFGRAALYTLYKVYENGEPDLVFASEYGDVERVVKLINQRNEEGEVSPAGFSSSVHNASVGLFSMLEKNKRGYNAISAGKKTIAVGFLESILAKDAVFCYAESLGGIKSVSVSVEQTGNGGYILAENCDSHPSCDTFEDFIGFLDGKRDLFVSDGYNIQRIAK